MTALELRTQVAQALTDAGIRAKSYKTETLTPPCAVVVPGQPYILPPAPGRDIPFGCHLVRIDVLVVAGPESAKAVEDRMDQLITTALEALDARDVVSVSRPGLTPLSTTSSTKPAPKFVAAVITIEEVTEA